MERLPIASRAEAFAALVSQCEITGKEGPGFEVDRGVERACDILLDAREKGASIYIIGNGGSAGVASHATIDFVNVGRLRAFTLHDSALLTCMTNDYGYENAYARILAQVARKGDVLIAISSSGRSKNILNAAQQASEKSCSVVTLSGFSPDNPLRGRGELNVWLNSSDYGMVEIGHQFVLHNISDRFGLLSREEA